MNEPAKDFYTLNVECPNCHFSQKDFPVPKGKKLDDVECPNCGNQHVLLESIKTTSYYNFGNQY